MTFISPTLSNWQSRVSFITLPLPALMFTSWVLSLLTFTYLDIMAPTEDNVRKSNRVAALTLHSKRTKRAGGKRLATPLTVNLSIDEEVPVSVHEDFFQKLDALIKVVTDSINSAFPHSETDCIRNGHST